MKLEPNAIIYLRGKIYRLVKIKPPTFKRLKYLHNTCVIGFNVYDKRIKGEFYDCKCNCTGI